MTLALTDERKEGRVDAGSFDVKMIVEQGEAHDGPLKDFSAHRPASNLTRIIVEFVVDSFSPS